MKIDLFNIRVQNGIFQMYQIKSGQNFSPNLILSSCSVWQWLLAVAVPWWNHCSEFVTGIARLHSAHSDWIRNTCTRAQRIISHWTIYSFSSVFYHAVVLVSNKWLQKFRVKYFEVGQITNVWQFIINLKANFNAY